MKYLICLCMAALMLACNQHINTITNSKSSNETVLVRDRNGTTNLLGKFDRSYLLDSPFVSWYQQEYEIYQPVLSAMDSLKKEVSALKFEIFLGTWCGDSKREVPRLLKLLDLLQVPSENINLIGVGSLDSLYKRSPGGEERGKSIYRVPHLNVYAERKEIGRITETPVVSWERDLIRIVNKLPYQPTHAALQDAATLLDKEGIYNEQTFQILLAKLRNLSLHSPQLLNSYGYVNLYDGRPEKALLAFDSNAKLFPSTWYVYQALANYYKQIGNREKERINLQTALQLKPDQVDVKERLTKLN